MEEKTSESQQEIPTLLQTARRDRIYTTQEAASFAFGEQVALVFDDMISRSVPGYLDLQLLVASCAVKFYQEGKALYDLGCSTGTSLALIAKRLPQCSDIYGIDNSEAMLKQAKQKLSQLGVRSQIHLAQGTLQDVPFKESCFMTSNYTLQFLPQADRMPMLEKIFSALTPGGAFLISEKTLPSLPTADAQLMKELHEDFKRQNGYTESEVARKRESLTGVMCPIESNENIKQLKDVGFRTVFPVLQGYSFYSWLCIK